MEQRIAMTTNEKLAREVSGIESAKHFVINNETADKTLEREAAMKHNDMVDDYINKLNDHSDRVASYLENFKKNMKDLELKAIGNNIIVKPFKENPFQKITVSKSGIITDLGGLAPEYKSNETGEIEEEESFIIVCEVIDAGPDCKWIQDGDVIFTTRVSLTPVPFFKQGLEYLNENRVMAVVNEGLTARFNKNKN